MKIDSHWLRAPISNFPFKEANTAARSMLALAMCTRFSATSRLKRERMPSSLDFMMAALAASSVVGGSGTGVDVRGTRNPDPLEGRGVPDRVGAWDGVGEISRLSPFTSALAAVGLLPNFGKTFTGIMTTFLNEERKSLLSAWRLTFSIYIDSNEASCWESCLSQVLTSISDFRLKKANSSDRYLSMFGAKTLHIMRCKAWNRWSPESRVDSRDLANRRLCWYVSDIARRYDSILFLYVSCNSVWRYGAITMLQTFWSKGMTTSIEAGNTRSMISTWILQAVDKWLKKQLHSSGKKWSGLLMLIQSIGSPNLALSVNSTFSAINLSTALCPPLRVTSTFAYFFILPSMSRTLRPYSNSWATASSNALTIWASLLSLRCHPCARSLLENWTICASIWACWTGSRYVRNILALEGCLDRNASL